MGNRITALSLFTAFSCQLCNYAQLPATSFPLPEISVESVGMSAGSSMPEKWTFNDCVEWAASHSTEIRRSILDILLADEEIAGAKDAWLPTVGFSTSHNFTNYPFPDNNQKSVAYMSSYGVNAAWTVWEGNVRKYRLESAKIARSRQMLAGDDVMKTIRLGILQAFLNIMYADEAVEIARQTLQTSTSQTDRARRLMEAGKSSKVEVAQIESQMAQDSYNLVQAEGNSRSARANLKKILELNLDYDIDIDSSSLDDDDVYTPLPEMSQVFSMASSWLPEIKSNELARQMHDCDIKIAKAGNMPEISLSGGVGSVYASGGKSWGAQMGHGLNENIGINISVPIFDGNSTKRNVAKAKLSALEYDLNRENLLNELSQTIESLYIDSRNARARYKAGLTNLESTRQTSDLVSRQFELGLVNPLELLTAHNNLLNARLELLQNKYMAILASKTIEFYATSDVEL